MITQIERGTTAKESIDFVMEECCNCGIPFFIPSYHRKQLIADKRFFYCPNGHSQYYSTNEADRLKDQLKREKERHDKEQSELYDKWLAEAGARAKAERLLKRVHKGVCPCCNRSFANLQQHMKKQHPEVKADK